MRLLLTCLALIFILFRQLPPQGRDEPLVLTNVNVIDAKGPERPLKPNRTVVIDGGRIAEIGESEKIRPPQGARVVDAKDKFLIPGLWDMHVHWYHEAFLPLFIANGVTGVRQMTGFVLHQDWRKKAERGELLSPRLSVASMLVDGPGATMKGSFEIADESQARDVVRKIKGEGFDFVKIYPGIPRDAFYALADECTKQKISFIGHVPHAVSALEASDAGMKSIEHMTGVLEACSPAGREITRGYLKNMAGVSNQTGMDADRRKAQRLLFEKMLDTYDRELAAAMFARFAKNGTWHCPTLVVNRVLGLIGEADFRDDSRVKYMPEYFRNAWQPQKNPLWAFRTDEDYAVSKRRFAKETEAVAEMREAGVRFIAGTDTGNPYCFPGFSLHDELGLLVKAGFTPLEAIQTATLNAAVFLGRADSLGTIEKGKIADLVLLEADPLKDIGNTRRIAAVIQGGKIYEKRRLEAMLVEAEKLANAKTDEKVAHSRSKSTPSSS
ncbi:MAG: amidohydrolase family protein [Candidatus Aminicenantes bacterium]|nr:amidohydrolase family protein [Candidatus Aminicenantes bacterium]